MKKYIWGFPGIGKSSLNIAGVRLVDADCERFKYKNTNDDELHGVAGTRYFEPDDNYPQNYLDYIRSVDADIVLVNCHLSLLENLDKESVLIVYPCPWLMTEYFQRYINRGDDGHFISYMAEEAPNIFEAIKASDYKKYQVFTFDTYLNDLFERKDFKMKLMSRQEIIDSIQRAMTLKVIDTNEENTALVCSLGFVNGVPSEHRISNAEVWAEAVLDGEYSLDIDQLLAVCAKREAIVEQERIALERRGGLSREELEDKIMQGIVNGALHIHHGQIAPYSYGYEVQFMGGGAGGAGLNRWECYCDLFNVPQVIADKIEQDSQNKRTFSSIEPAPFNIKAFLSAIDAAEKTKITSFTPEKDSSLVRTKNSYTHPYRNSIAGIGDVHKGNGLDGIAKGSFGGDYSSMTTSSQNDLVQTLVFMKGFCLDCLNHLHSVSAKESVIKYLKKHGTDISTPEKLQEWIKANPEKCGKEENRVRQLPLDEQIKASSLKNDVEAVSKPKSQELNL